MRDIHIFMHRSVYADIEHKMNDGKVTRRITSTT